MRTSSRAAVVAVVALATLVVGSTAATAASPHVKSGPSFTDNGSTLTAKVTYAGLGNFDTTQTLTATGNPTAICTIPSELWKSP